MNLKKYMAAAIALVAGMLLVTVLVLTFAQMDDTVKGRGVVKTGSYTMITPDVSGFVVKKLKKAGDTVTAGEVLAILNTTAVKRELDRVRKEVAIRRNAIDEFESDLERASERVKVASARVESARVELGRLEALPLAKQIANAGEAVRQKEISLEQRRKEKTDAEQLSAKGLVSKVDLDRANAQAKIAESELTVARNNLDILRLKKDRPDIEAGRKNLLRWEAELKLAKLDLENKPARRTLERELEKAKLQVTQIESAVAAHKIRAPRSGQLVYFDVWENQMLSASGGAMVGQIQDKDNLKFEIYVRQVDAPWVQVGQEALIELDSFPYRQHGCFEGVVSKVAPRAVHEPPANGAAPATSRALEVEIDIKPSEFRILPGYEGEVEIIIEKVRVIEWLLGLRTLSVRKPPKADQSPPSPAEKPPAPAPAPESQAEGPAGP